MCRSLEPRPRPRPAIPSCTAWRTINDDSTAFQHAGDPRVSDRLVPSSSPLPTPWESRVSSVPFQSEQYRLRKSLAIRTIFDRHPREGSFGRVVYRYLIGLIGNAEEKGGYTFNGHSRTSRSSYLNLPCHTQTLKSLSKINHCTIIYDTTL